MGFVMRKLGIKNDYIEDIFVSGKDLNILLASERYFKSMKGYLDTNATILDHNMVEEDREFYYTSNRTELTVTIKGNISQALELLVDGGYFDKVEKNKILKHLESAKYTTTLKMAFPDKNGDPDDTVVDEKTPLLGK